MERVAFLLERTGERIACLLNPESLVLRRRAGLRSRQSAGGLVTGAELADDPIFCTGGGTTELTLNLLFDVNVSGSSITATDVRELTGPLWRLAENIRTEAETLVSPVRLILGKSLNFRGVVAAVAERLEHFTPDGVPQRAWMRMRMLRVAESAENIEGGALIPPSLPADPSESPPELPDGPLLMHAVSSSAGAEPEPEAGVSERLDQIAFRYYGDPDCWRVLAWLNGIADPLCLAAGQVLQVAARADITASAQ